MKLPPLRTLMAVALLFTPGLLLADSNPDLNALGLSPQGSQAIIDFLITAPAGGSVFYNGVDKHHKNGGAPNPLIGNNIGVNGVEGFYTPQHNFVKLRLVGGQLNFQTADYSSFNATTWYFDGPTNGDFITLTATCVLFGPGPLMCGSGHGVVPDLNGVPGLVMTGFWSSAMLVESNPKNKIDKMQAGLIDDTVWQQLLGFYGLANPPNGGYLSGDFNLSMKGSGNPNKSFKSTTVLSGDFGDVNVPYSPEPGSLLLFGTGLVGVAGIVRRKLNRG